MSNIDPSIHATQYQALFQVLDTLKPTAIAPLSSPKIDGRDELELLDSAIQKVGSASEGRLNDFSLGSPTRAMLSGHALIAARIAAYADAVASKAAIDFLQIAGVQRITGVRASSTLQFLLTGALTTDFSVPKGYRVRAGQQVFSTDTELIIRQGERSGSVTATAETAGTSGNVKARTIRSPFTRLAFLDEVFNPSAATGGKDAETESATIARGFISLRQRGLITRWDYENFARSILGNDIVVRALGRVDQQGNYTEIPQVLTVACESDGSALSDAKKSLLTGAMDQAGHINVTHHVRDMTVTRIDVNAIVEVEANADPVTVAGFIWKAITEYLSISERWLNTQLISSEILWRIRNVEGTRQVNNVYFVKFPYEGNSALDSYHTGLFETLQARSAVLTILKEDRTFIVPFGPGDPD